jgi:hypothetical protein
MPDLEEWIESDINSDEGAQRFSLFFSASFVIVEDN